MPDGNTMVVLQGKKRFEIEELVQEKPYLKAKVKEVVESVRTKLTQNSMPSLIQ